MAMCGFRGHSSCNSGPGFWALQEVGGRQHSWGGQGRALAPEGTMQYGAAPRCQTLLDAEKPDVALVEVPREEHSACPESCEVWVVRPGHLSFARG